MSPYEATEYFHLIFLTHLSKRVVQSHVALKGGCNLRFYFKSIRYSEDIDFDVHKISIHTLRNNMRKIFDSKLFIDGLSAAGIAITEFSEPKQTTTTQRWKALLKLDGIDRKIPTKIEFSRRDGVDGAVVEPIDRDVLVKYRLYPIYVCHYPRVLAVQQKIKALIGRAQTQARDIFDLSLLIHGKLDLKGYSIDRAQADEICKQVDNLNFDDYLGQVVAYLMPEYQRQYGSELEWNRMISEVVNFVRKVCDEPT